MTPGEASGSRRTLLKKEILLLVLDDFDLQYLKKTKKTAKFLKFLYEKSETFYLCKKVQIF